MNITGDEPIAAFEYDGCDDFGGPMRQQTGGLTIRQYFAAKAMQGILANPVFFEKHDDIDIHVLAVGNANSLIAELNKTV